MKFETIQDCKNEAERQAMAIDITYNGVRSNYSMIVSILSYINFIIFIGVIVTIIISMTTKAFYIPWWAFAVYITFILSESFFSGYIRYKITHEQDKAKQICANVILTYWVKYDSMEEWQRKSLSDEILSSMNLFNKI